MSIPSTRLAVPKVSGERAVFEHDSEGKLRGWMDELPIGNAVQTAKELVSQLRIMNRAATKRAARFSLLEVLRPLVNDLAVTLTGHYKAASMPLNAEQQTQAELVLRLHNELATGYKLVVNEQLDAAERGVTENISLLLQLGTQRAILSLGRELMESYRIYAAEPAHLWRDVHTLYRNAERFSLQAQPIEGTRDADETALSIKQAYLRVAVLALANPYHLMSGEAEDLYRRIGRWVHFVQIRKPDSNEAVQGKFLIDLGADFPARYVPHGLKVPPSKEPRMLELGRLVDTIAEQITRFNDTLARSRAATVLSERMQRDMYIRFKEALGGRQERTDERKPTVAKLSLVEGLSASHYFLNGRRAFTPEEDEASWNARLGGMGESHALRLQHEERLDGKAVEKRYSQRGRFSRFDSFDADLDDVWRKANMVSPDRPQEFRQRRVNYRAVPWHRKNESAGGMALYCAEQAPMQVRVGELLAYTDRDGAKPQDWKIGVLRWLRTRPNGGLEMGVKHLADSGWAVGVKAVQGPGSGAEYLRAIMIPRVNPLTQTATLVVPAAVFDVGSVIRLNLRELVIYAKLSELVETTRLFSHFRFRVVEQPAVAREKKSRLELEPKDDPKPGNWFNS